MKKPGMQIVSASRRTDIPAFYSEWLMNRLREGFARVPNPFNPRQVRTVPLRPEQVACLVFWTRDPRPMLPHLDELDSRGYRHYFQVTITGLPGILEPGVPEPAGAIRAMRQLASRIGSSKVIWRFDPILFSRSVSSGTIIRTFNDLAGQLAGSAATVVVSFGREYRRVGARLRKTVPQEEVRFIRAGSPEKVRLATALAETAAARGMKIQSCADPEDLTPYGIPPGSCVDSALIGELFQIEFAPGRDPGQRGDCRCARSVDIGIYGTCPHRCLYCYASCDSALANGMHSPLNPSLLEQS